MSTSGRRYRDKQGYRSAVELTKEEYEELNKHREKERQYLDALERLSTEKCALYCPLVVKASKEKAAEILNKIANIDDCGFPMKRYVWFNKIAKENGVEVK